MEDFEGLVDLGKDHSQRGCHQQVSEELLIVIILKDGLEVRDIPVVVAFVFESDEEV